MKATVLLLLLLVASIAQPAPVGPGKRRSDDRQPLVISQYSKVGPIALFLFRSIFIGTKIQF